MLGEGAEERVVAGLLPEAVDVHPEASGAVGEGRRVRGHAGEGTSEQVDVHSGASPGKLPDDREERIERVPVHTGERHLAPEPAGTIGEQGVLRALPLGPGDVAGTP